MGAAHTTILGGAQQVHSRRNDAAEMSAIEGSRRIAYCECGARLAGNSEQELFDAAQQHLAQDHPRLLGALGAETVKQMAEELGGRKA